MLKLNELTRRIGVSFKNQDLLKEAVTHRSYLNEHPSWDVPHNERLEFLGDAVLELIITHHLFAEFPEEAEGKLTVLRAALVNYQALTRVAQDIDLQNYIFMSRGERSDNAKAREVILANAIEAVIGAIFLDQGYTAAETFVKKLVLPYLSDIMAKKSYRDAKSELQEMAQERFKVTPNYEVLEESGPAHDRTFKIGVYFGRELIAEGHGSSKQEAEIAAAKDALRKYEK